MSFPDHHPGDEPGETLRTATAAGVPAAATGADADDERFRPGAQFGRYEILEVLGQGGMGVVYGARDADLDRRVALKLMRKGKTGRAADLAGKRLLREAKALAKLKHPNVMTVYEVGTVEKRNFIAMECMDGGDLAEWLKQERPGWKRVLEVFIAAGRGLAAAHAAGLVHRDFKPANVLMERDGRVVVTDFGLVRPAAESGPAGEATAAEPDADALTRAGVLVGTPAYMAPEQHRGDAVDARSDQYSFCVALFEGLHGRRPFAAATLSGLRDRILRGEIAEEPRKTAVPRAIRRAVRRGLSADPAARFSSMDELLEALSRDPGARRRRWLAAGAAAVVVATAALAGVFGYRHWVGREGTGSTCAAQLERFTATWTEADGERVRDAFAAAGSPNAASAFAGFSRELERYRASWQRAHGAVCEAGDGGDGFHHRMSCLGDGLAQLEAMIAHFADADATLVEHAVAAARTLPDPELCSRPDTRELGPAIVGTELAEARAFEQALRFDDGLKRARAALERAEASGSRSGRAAAWQAIGGLLLNKNDTDGARSALEEAALLAEEADHPRIHAQALVALAELAASRSSDREAASTAARRARAAVARYGRAPALAARLDRAEAHIAWLHDDIAGAQALFERALTAHLSSGGDWLRAARVMFELAALHQERGRFAEAAELGGDAVELLERRLGGDHPAVVEALSQAAVHLGRLGDYDRSRAYRLRAEAYWQTGRGRELLRERGIASPDVGDTRTVRGTVVADGRPVAGAEVIIGPRIQGDGKYLMTSMEVMTKSYLDWRRTVSDAAGEFSVAGVPPGEFVIAAESEWGRSLGDAVAAGREDVAGLALHLQPFGRLEGRIAVADGSRSRERRGPLHVQARPTATSGRVAVLVHADRDGAFVFERLPAGEYRLLLRDEETRLAAANVRIEAGETAAIEFSPAAASLVVAIELRGRRGAALDNAQIYLIPGRADPRSGADIMRLLGERKMSVKTVTGDGPSSAVIRAEFAQAQAGEYTLCAAPFAGDIRDPAQLQRLVKHRDEVEVHCRRIAVAPQPERQSFTMEVPPMRALPEPRPSP